MDGNIGEIISIFPSENRAKLGRKKRKNLANFWRISEKIQGNHGGFLHGKMTRIFNTEDLFFGGAPAELKGETSKSEE